MESGTILKICGDYPIVLLILSVSSLHPGVHVYGPGINDVACILQKVPLLLIPFLMSAIVYIYTI
jgi:hypothetical protein